MHVSIELAYLNALNNASQQLLLRCLILFNNQKEADVDRGRQLVRVVCLHVQDQFTLMLVVVTVLGMGPNC